MPREINPGNPGVKLEMIGESTFQEIIAMAILRCDIWIKSDFIFCRFYRNFAKSKINGIHFTHNT